MATREDEPDEAGSSALVPLSPYQDETDEVANASAARAQGYVAMGKFHGTSRVIGVSSCILFWAAFCLHMYTSLFDPTETPMSRENHPLSWIQTWSLRDPISVLNVLLIMVPLTVISLMHLWYPAVWRKPSHTMPQLLAQNAAGDSLVMHFRYVTRGTNPVLVNKNVAVAESVLTASGLPLDRWCLEVVTDNPVLCSTHGHGPRVSEVVVPSSFVCPNGGKYKARALHYAINAELEIPIHDHDWIVHLDEETSFDIHTVCACYAHCLKQNAEVAADVKQVPNIGQGPIVYNYGHVPDFQLGALADVRRVSDDLIFFRATWEIGRPYVGMHGSFVVASQKTEKLIGFDHGDAGSVTEDAYFALYAWGKMDLKFSWIDAFMFEQSPFCIMDFIRQRARWFHGLNLIIATNGDVIPLRCRLPLACAVIAWCAVGTMVFLGTVGVGLVLLMLGGEYTAPLQFTLGGNPLLIWYFMLGFMINVSPHAGGWDRWLLSLWMVSSLLTVFAFMEAGGLILGLKLLWDARPAFYVVQKERKK